MIGKFEDLVGPLGGGCQEKQLATIKHIAQRMGHPINDTKALSIAQQLFGESATFVEGKIGAWKDYFTQEVVTSNLFGGAITVYEPSHTITEYLNPEFLKNFDINFYEEKFDPSNAEKVEGASYPAFFCMSAKKR